MFRLIYPRFWQKKGWISYLLWPFSMVYIGLVYFVRELLLDVDLRSYKKVIAIGNITMGGTGKTQIALYLANLMKKINFPTLIVTRCYKAEIKDSTVVDDTHTPNYIGDEAYMCYHRGYPVVSTPTVYAAKRDILKHKEEMVILDDFARNPFIPNAFIILTVDAERGFGNNMYFPAGPLRGNIKEMTEYADIIMHVGDESNIENFPPEYIPHMHKVIQAVITPTVLGIDTSKRYVMFCGIGNPDKFLITLKGMGINVVGTEIYPDHHHYSEEDLEHLRKVAESHDAELITTEKDYIKIKDPADYIQCVKVDLKVTKEDEERLLRAINTKLV